MGAQELSLNNRASAPCYLPCKEPRDLHGKVSAEAKSAGFNGGLSTKNHTQYVVVCVSFFVNHSFSWMHTDRVLSLEIFQLRHSQIESTSRLLSNFRHDGEDPCLSGFQNEHMNEGSGHQKWPHGRARSLLKLVHLLFNEVVTSILSTFTDRSKCQNVKNPQQHRVLGQPQQQQQQQQQRGGPVVHLLPIQLHKNVPRHPVYDSRLRCPRHGRLRVDHQGIIAFP